MHWLFSSVQPMPSPQNPHIIRCSLPSSLTSYHELVQQVLDKLQELGWNKENIFGVHMALEESISNAIRHGNHEDPSKQVHFQCELAENRFYAQVCDEGTGYDPGVVPDCCLPENLETPGGRGLALIRAFMTTVTHSDEGRCVTMEKLLD